MVGRQEGRRACVRLAGAAIRSGAGPCRTPELAVHGRGDEQPELLGASEAPEGVPISAIVFGGRRAKVAPLVFEAKDWAHGVLVGASVGSKMTAAAFGDVGKIRRDPMAMKPFCGYNFADYWSHWLTFPERTDKLPKIFHVNWFRQDDDGNFLWPGFGENLRVLRWIVDRCENRCGARETPIGYLPNDGDIDTSELEISTETMRDLLSIDVEHWRTENEHFADYLDEYGDRVPDALRKSSSAWPRNSQTIRRPRPAISSQAAVRTQQPDGRAWFQLVPIRRS